MEDRLGGGAGIQAQDGLAGRAAIHTRGIELATPTKKASPLELALLNNSAAHTPQRPLLEAPRTRHFQQTRDALLRGRVRRKEIRDTAAGKWIHDHHLRR